MRSGFKFFLSIFFGFVLALVVNSFLTSIFCAKDDANSLCSISSIILVPTATLVFAIVFYLVIPNQD